jgi:succinate dehydrogenase / fumarate reductase membrane anchor subunit
MAGTPDMQPHNDILRSPLGRARGLGAAHMGSGQWWSQRLTSLALVPLTLWFVISVIRLTGEPREAMVAWLSAPLAMALMLALIVATFHHLQLGLQVVIEDYVPNEPVKMLSLLLMKALCVLLALVCIISVLKIGL